MFSTNASMNATASFSIWRERHPRPRYYPQKRLTPAQHGTDGFFVALFERKSDVAFPGSPEGRDPEPMNTDRTVSC